MSWLWSLMAPLAVLLLAALATRGVLVLLHRKSVLDHPNHRSSHSAPVPRGGGIAVMAALSAGWLAYGLTAPEILAPMLVVLAAAVMLAGVSFIDDLRDLTALTRILFQLLAVLLGLMVIAEQGLVFQGWLPPMLDLALVALVWLWFINLFNFMDGIDGLAGLEAICLSLGLVLAGALAGFQPPALMLAAAAAGFLLFNWSPARVFLGDVGSVPLGYLLGFLLLAAATEGAWAPALILPLYYLADATLTLGRRVLRGEKFWHGHRQHFYQQAVQRGFSHAAVSHRVLIANALLIALALLAGHGHVLLALLGAVLVVAALLLWMARARPAVPASAPAA